MLDKLYEIEEKIDYDKFVIYGENIWPVFRTVLGSELTIDKHNIKIDSENKNNRRSIKTFFNYIRCIPKDMYNLCKSYDYILLSTSDDYKIINNQIVNRLTNEIFKQEKDAKVLNIMKIFQNQRVEIEKSISDTVVMNLSIQVIVKVFSLFVKDKQNSILLANEFARHNIELKEDVIHKILCNHKASKIIYKILLNFIKPKAIITTDYTNLQIINMANILKVPTVEILHGDINEHFGYDIFHDINNNFYSNYVLTFGTLDKKYLQSRFYVKETNNIYPVGNLMVDYYQKKSNTEIKNLKNEYTYIVAVSLQWTVAKKMISYIAEQANKYKNLCFILIPREENDLKDYDKSIQNIKTFANINCYEIVSNSDYHMTSYSSCALESLSLGTPNIFLNINNFSRRYFNEFIKKNTFNTMLNPNEDIIDKITSNNIFDNEEVLKSNSEYIILNYKQNIKYVYQKILGRVK